MSIDRDQTVEYIAECIYFNMCEEIYDRIEVTLCEEGHETDNDTLNNQICAKVYEMMRKNA